MIVTWKFHPGPPEEHSVLQSIEHGGRWRTYLLHVPPSLREGEPAPLVLALHGTGGTGTGMEAVTGLSPLSDRHGFIVAYPDAVDRSWNDGRGLDHLPSHRQGVDDVGFAVDLVGEIRRAHAVDPGRIFAAGISNGAFFSHYLAARRADLVAAIAPVAGGMAPAVAGDFRPARPVSVLALQGTDDPLIPYAGGEVKWYRGGVVAAEEAVRKWAEVDGCRPDPRREEVPLQGPGEGMRVRRDTYGGGREGAEAGLVTIEGGGHTWPGGLQFLPERIIGKTCRGVNASELIWEFFSGHPRA
jgi:polyhydroxybutyrate depolymerase